MAGPKDTSETSLMSVGDLIELAFCEGNYNEVNFKLVEAILLILARSLCLLQRCVEVKAPKAQVVASFSKISIAEVRVSVRQDISQEDKKLLAFDTSTSKAKGTEIKSTEKLRDSYFQEPIKEESAKIQNYKSDKESSKQIRRRISETTEDTFKNTSVEEPTKYKSAKTQNYKSDKESSKQIRRRISETAEDTFKNTSVEEPTNYKSAKTQNYKSDKESSNQIRRRISETAEDTFKNTSVEEPTEYKSAKTQNYKSDKEASNQIRRRISETAEDTFKNTSVEEPTKYKSAKTQSNGEPNKQSSKQITVKMSAAASETFEPSGENKETYSKLSSDRSGRRRFRETDPSQTSEIHQEKILIVGREHEMKTSSMSTSKHNKPGRDMQLKNTAKVAPHSLVTKDQFDELLDVVYSLQKQLTRKDLSNTDSKLLDDLYKNVTFADPMAVLQLSARLEVVEKAVNDMMEVLKDLAKPKVAFEITDDLEDTRKKEKGTAFKKGTQTKKMEIKPALSTISEEVNKSDITKDSKFTPEDHIKFMKEDTEDDETSSSISKTSDTSEVDEDTSTKKRHSITESVVVILLPSATSVVPSEFQGRMLVDAATTTDSETDAVETNEDYFHKLITREDIETWKQQLLKEATQIAKGPVDRAMSAIKTTLEKANDIASDLNKVKTQENDIELLERSAADYAERITAADVDLSLKMTQITEELVSMQFDLEVKLENLMESLANRESDTKAMSQLDNRMTSLLGDIIEAGLEQTSLSTAHTIFRRDISDLWEILKELNLIKTDRIEAEEAINSKVGRAVLNNMPTKGQFAAVIDFAEIQMVSLYHLANKKEVSWQAVIDNLLTTFDERATEFQVKVLFGDIDGHITRLGKRLDSMLDILEHKPNEPMTNALKTYEPCLCCNTPAKENKVELANIGTESKKLDATDKNPKGETDNHEKKCYKGERARFCHKYGRHRLNTCAEADPFSSGIDVKAITKLDSDSEKIYREGSPRLKPSIERQMTDFMIQPCKPCNAEKRKSAPPSISSQIHKIRCHTNSDDSKTIMIDLYDIYLDLRSSRISSKELRRLTLLD